jgi:hypothetical protein
VRTDSLSYEQNSYESPSGRKTRLLEKDNLVFNESFHYNTSELFDDNLTFILRAKDGHEFGRHTIRRLRDWHRHERFTGTLRNTKRKPSISSTRMESK